MERAGSPTIERCPYNKTFGSLEAYRPEIRDYKFQVEVKVNIGIDPAKPGDDETAFLVPPGIAEDSAYIAFLHSCGASSVYVMPKVGGPIYTLKDWLGRSEVTTVSPQVRPTET